MSDAVKKVVLAYSGGLDTSVILRWLQETYRCEVVTFTADLGQGEELGPARRKAELLGVSEIFVDDLREEFVRDFVFPMFRANALYEGAYLLGTLIARPLIAKHQIEIAHQVGADAVTLGTARATTRSASSSAMCRAPRSRRRAGSCPRPVTRISPISGASMRPSSLWSGDSADSPATSTSFFLPDEFDDAVSATAAELGEELVGNFAAIFSSDSASGIDLRVNPGEARAAHYHGSLRADGSFPPLLAGGLDGPVRDGQSAWGRSSARVAAILIAPAIRHLSGHAPVPAVERHRHDCGDFLHFDAMITPISSSALAHERGIMDNSGHDIYGLSP